jgi:hypothetical protein
MGHGVESEGGALFFRKGEPSFWKDFLPSGMQLSGRNNSGLPERDASALVEF